MKDRKNKNGTSTPNKSTSKTELNPEELENKFYENIVDTVREPLLILDKELRVVKASKSFLDFFKVSPEETIGEPIYDLGNKQWDIPKLRELLETILPEKTIFNNFEVEHIFRTIGKRFMLLNARQIERAFGNEKVILLAIEDITLRKREEKLLREKNELTSEYLNILLDHAHAPIIIWDSALRINRFNHEFEKLSGYESSEVIDKPIEMLFPKVKAVSMIELLKSHLTNTDTDAIEVDILTKDKTIKTVLWNSTNIFDDEDKNIVATIAQDITNRKQVENRLEILETRYRRLFESAKDGIIILDAETGKIIDINPFLCELLDYSKDKFIDKELWQIGFFKDIAANKEKFSKLQNEEYVRYEDLPLKTATGRKINVEFISNVYLVNSHKVIQCNIRDITKHKHAEDKLRISENRLSTLVQTIPDLIWLKDVNGVYLLCNPMFERFFGAGESDIVGKTDYDFVDKNLADSFRENDIKAMAAGKPTSNEELITFADNGQSIYLETIKTRYHDNNNKLIGVLGIGRDITERKRNEKELRKLSRTVEQSPLSIIITDAEGIIEYINPKVTELTGYKSEEVIGKNPRIFSSGEKSKSDYKKLWTTITSGKEWRGEFHNKKKNGELYWESASISPIINDKGIITNYLAVKEDITEQKRVAEELFIAKEKAEESDKLKSEFLAQMSHEIRTPINAVLGYVGYLSDLISKPKNSEVVDCFNGIDLASKRIIRTIDLLLNAAELQTGSYQPRFLQIDLDKEILDKLYIERSRSAKERGLELIYNCTLNNANILADDYSTTQIFVNLIDNAIKYTREGKVEILLTKNLNGNVIVEIKDTGIGISKEFLPRLFNSFEQEEQGYSRSFEGNGLGLALVKRYCEINDALIEVESEKNVGSTFRVVFDKKFTVNAK